MHKMVRSTLGRRHDFLNRSGAADAHAAWLTILSIKWQATETTADMTDLKSIFSQRKNMLIYLTDNVFLPKDKRQKPRLQETHESHGKPVKLGIFDHFLAQDNNRTKANHRVVKHLGTVPNSLVVCLPQKAKNPKSKMTNYDTDVWQASSDTGCTRARTQRKLSMKRRWFLKISLSSDCVIVARFKKWRKSHLLKLALCKTTLFQAFPFPLTVEKRLCDRCRSFFRISIKKAV